jgi:hypothetical protein
MHQIEIVFFAVSLFLALAALSTWKHRRDAIAARLNRGLRGYAEKSAVLAPGPEEAHRENLMPVLENLR